MVQMLLLLAPARPHEAVLATRAMSAAVRLFMFPHGCGTYTKHASAQ
jgi:hypothetical protein